MVTLPAGTDSPGDLRALSRGLKSDPTMDGPPATRGRHAEASRRRRGFCAVRGGRRSLGDIWLDGRWRHHRDHSLSTTTWTPPSPQRAPVRELRQISRATDLSSACVTPWTFPGSTRPTRRSRTSPALSPWRRRPGSSTRPHQLNPTVERVSSRAFGTAGTANRRETAVARNSDGTVVATFGVDDADAGQHPPGRRLRHGRSRPGGAEASARNCSRSVSNGSRRPAGRWCWPAAGTARPAFRSPSRSAWTGPARTSCDGRTCGPSIMIVSPGWPRDGPSTLAGLRPAAAARCCPRPPAGRGRHADRGHQRRPDRRSGDRGRGVQPGPDPRLRRRPACLRPADLPVGRQAPGIGRAGRSHPGRRLRSSIPGRPGSWTPAWSAPTAVTGSGSA